MKKCNDWPFTGEPKVKPIRLAVAIRISSVLVVTLLTACTKQLVRVPEPVGPVPIVQPPSNVGRLVVTTEEIPRYSDETYTTHEPYAVRDASGRLVKEVLNESGTDIVELASGRYSIQAQSPRRRLIAVDVRIVAGRTTEVHLDGNWEPKTPRNSATLVMGPDGPPVGYRFTPAMAPSAAVHATEPSREAPTGRSSR